MKVVILGGYGVFGARLATLLIRDGHQVWLAGRDREKAQDMAARLGGHALTVDLNRDPAQAFAPGPDVVIDAAGPFQAYGADPYSLARLCLAHGAHYLDLSDDTGFTEGIATFDRQARAAGLCLLSGASSVPGLSSAVAADLCRGLDEVLLIDSAILPGNRAPRGRSVIAGIASQLGRDAPVWRGGTWRAQRTWGDPRRIELAPGLVRPARFIEVPDIRLFPGFFGARAVMFRAGMELGILNLGLRALGALRRVWPFAMTPGRVRVLQWLAERLLGFGTDRGGMRVMVVGPAAGQVVRREWRMVAEAGDGPFVPGVTVRALLRRLDRVPPGARACLAEFTLAEAESAMSDLAITSRIVEAPRPSLFRAALADRWAQLPPQIQALHQVQDVESFSGMARVTRGQAPLARLIGAVFRFPRAAREVPVTVTKTRLHGHEVWERNFGGRVFRSRCSPAPDTCCVNEAFWPFRFELHLPIHRGEMRFEVRRGWLLGLPLPRSLLPGSDSREHVRNGLFHFDVGLHAPLGAGLIVRYQGWLTRDGDAPDRPETLRRSPAAR